MRRAKPWSSSSRRFACHDLGRRGSSLSNGRIFSWACARRERKLRYGGLRGSGGRIVSRSPGASSRAGRGLVGYASCRDDQVSSRSGGGCGRDPPPPGLPRWRVHVDGQSAFTFGSRSRTAVVRLVTRFSNRDESLHALARKRYVVSMFGRLRIRTADDVQRAWRCGLIRAACQFTASPNCRIDPDRTDNVMTAR